MLQTLTASNQHQSTSLLEELTKGDKNKQKSLAFTLTSKTLEKVSHGKHFSSDSSQLKSKAEGEEYEEEYAYEAYEEYEYEEYEEDIDAAVSAIYDLDGNVVGYEELEAEYAASLFASSLCAFLFLA